MEKYFLPLRHLQLLLTQHSFLPLKKREPNEIELQLKSLDNERKRLKKSLRKLLIINMKLRGIGAILIRLKTVHDDLLKSRDELMNASKMK